MVSEAWKYFNKVVVNDKKYGDCKKCHKKSLVQEAAQMALLGTSKVARK